MTRSERATGDAPDAAASESDAVLRQFRKSLSSSGGGGGVSLHFDAEVAREFRLDPDTEVDVEVVEEDGDVAFKIRGIPAGFTELAIVEYADEQGWEETDSYSGRDGWSHTYRDPTGMVRIEMDSETHVDGDVVNNVFVQGDPIEVYDDLERYRDLCVAAVEKDLRVRVRDSDGLWQRLRGSHEHETDDAPDEETFQQLLNATDQVTVQLVQEMPSLHTTLADVGETVNSIRAVMRGYLAGSEEPIEESTTSG